MKKNTAPTFKAQVWLSKGSAGEWTNDLLLCLCYKYSGCCGCVVVIDSDVVFVGDSGGILVVRSSKSLAVESD